jgi:hypothetical protein
MNYLRWILAAILVIAIAGGIYLFLNSRSSGPSDEVIKQAYEVYRGRRSRNFKPLTNIRVENKIRCETNRQDQLKGITERWAVRAKFDGGYDRYNNEFLQVGIFVNPGGKWEIASFNNGSLLLMAVDCPGR